MGTTTKNEWDQRVGSGLVGLCEPVRKEFLRAVGGRPAYYEADGLLRETFPSYPMRDSAWEYSAQSYDAAAPVRFPGGRITHPRTDQPTLTALHAAATALYSVLPAP
ncbi:hypothetical protein ABT173_37850 [Streptomyces sp. NPDC001795]|uniref:hypothetical protein n=1 Tax=unclassified Streptomyces TaxID=2593676 RepID=UPI00332E7A7B